MVMLISKIREKRNFALIKSVFSIFYKLQQLKYPKIIVQ